MFSLLWVGIGGGLGSIARFGVSAAARNWIAPAWPLGTFAVNLLGSLAIGALLALGEERLGTPAFQFLVPGVLGGFTTYSAFAGETLNLLQRGEMGKAALYVAGTLLAGLAASALGFKLGQAL